ncbi:hypothetical protein EIP86_006295 [Pleurotus ostreatoroseus]|nr:hypothetical protein EIP86_006295 [Pleurotus ostreatoroseus]
MQGFFRSFGLLCSNFDSAFRLATFFVPNMILSGLGPNQICTLFGSTPGDSDVSGGAYLSVGYGIDIADQWRRNFLVLVGFFLLFQITQVLLIEFYPQYIGSGGSLIYAKPTRESKARNEALKERKARRGKDGTTTPPEKFVSKEESVSEGPHRRTFTWEAINYHVPVPGGTRRLLHDVYGYVKPGTLTATMGASGAGK